MKIKDDLQSMEDDFDIMDDDIVIMEDDHCYFLINQGRLNPFKFSEMIGNYKGKMLDEFSRLEDDLQQSSPQRESNNLDVITMIL